MFGKLFRLMIYGAAAVSLVAFGLALKARPYSSGLITSQPSYVYWLDGHAQFIPYGSGPASVSLNGFDRTWQVMTSPVLKGTQPGVWMMYPEPNPFRRAYFAIIDLLTTPIIVMVLFLAAIALMLRRRQHRALPPPIPPEQPRAAMHEPDPETEKKQRQQAEVIRRMYGVMDRIESRVERLESSLLR